MRWQEGGESDNVEDQRGLPVGTVLGGAGTIIVIVLGLLFGFDPRQLIQQQQQQQMNQARSKAPAVHGRTHRRKPARSPSSSTYSS